MSNFEFDAKPCQAYQPNTSTINNNSYCHQQHYRVHHHHHYPQQLQHSASRQYQETLNTTAHSHNITPTTALPSIQQFNSECYTNNQSTSPIVDTVSTDSSYIDPTLGGYLINNQPYKNLKQQQQQNLKMLTLSRSNTGSNNANSFSSCNNDYNNNNDNNYNLSELKYNNNNNRNSYCSDHHQLINNTVTNNRSTGALSHSQRQHPQRPNTLNLTATAPLTSLPKYFNTPPCTSNIVATSTTTCPTLPSSSFCLGKSEILQNNFNNYALLHNNGSNNNNLINYDHNHNNGNNCDNNLNDQSVNYTVEQQQYYHNSQNQHQQHQQIQHLQCLGQQLKQHQNSATAYDAAGTVTITETTTNNSYTVASCSTNDYTRCGGTDNAKNNSDKLTLDACEIANFLASELFMQQLVSMECMQTGVPTLTTPTLTPTTLRSIEESFIQLTSEPLNVPYQAGFIPPPLGSYNTSSNNNVNNNNNNNISNNNATTSANILTTNANLNNVYLGDLSGGTSLHEYGNLNDSETENSQGSWNPAQLNEENSLATTDTSSAATDSTSFQNGLNNVGINALNNSNSLTANNDFTKANIAALAAATSANTKMPNTSNTSNSATHTNAAATATPTRRGGGRRPAASTNMTPEEEEKRRIRRERNKLAAARCRKRRVDQTNELTEEVALLEKKREDLQKQIERLNSDKQELEYILKAHTCKKIHQDLLTVNSFAGLGANEPITGLDTSLASTARSISPMDLKPVLNDELLTQIKPEPLDSTLDSNSSLDQDGPPSPKRLLFDNPMVPPPLPNVATLSASLAAASASLNTPIVTTAPVNFGLMIGGNCTLNPPQSRPNSKQRPNSLPTVPRNMAQSLALNVNKPPTDINGVAIQTPSTGMFNFDSLMDGGTGLTPVSGPLVPNCSSQNKHPLELVTPTSEPSKILSL